MSKARIYARNLAANWIGHGASMVVLFFLSPFVVHTLGKVEYGIWSLLTVVTGYMGILDLGVRAGTGRFIILYIGKEQHDKVDQTIRTSLGFFASIGVFVIFIGAILGWIFPSVFSSAPSEYHTLIKLLLPLLAVNMLVTTFSSLFSSVLAAHDRFDIARGVDLIVLAVRTIGTIVVLKLGYGILGLAIVVVTCNFVGLASNRYLAGRIYRRLKAWPFMLSRARLRELLGFGIASFISAIAIKIIGQTDLVIVGAAISVSAVTVYSVGAMLVYYSSTFVELIGGTFFPPVQRAIARGEKGSARWLFFRQVRLAMIIGIPAYIGFIVFSESFIRLWMFGPKFPESSVRQAAVVMVILSCSKLPLLFTMGSGGILSAMGHIRLNAAISIIEAIANLALSLLFVLVFGWGLAGVAAGTLAARLLVRTFILPWYACVKAGINWWSFLLRVGGTGVLAGVIFAGCCLLLKHMLGADSWGRFWANVGLSLVIYIPIAILILVPKNDRKRVLAVLKTRVLKIENSEK